jgi:DNA helicase-2/ATP-dependent DNA helicase PcrA
VRVSHIPSPASDPASGFDCFAGLNPDQALAVGGPEPLLVVAGPGSGKTRVLTHRIAHFIQSGTKPWRILAVTFTNKAAGEMRERLAGILGEDAAGELWVSTFHSMCVKILRREHATVGLPKSFSIVDADDAERVLRRFIQDEGLFAQPEMVRETAKDAHHAISAAKNRMEVLHSTGRGSLGWIAEGYQARLASMGACDFDDLLVLTVRALQDPEVRERWAGRFDHILVDEFQDTNEPQLAIVRLLAQRAQITAVGDAQQAIYGFRGAHAEAMEEFRRSFPAAGTVVLGQNYRSTQPILDVCQAVIDENGPGAPRLWSEEKHGAAPIVRECDDDRDEAAWICRLVQRAAAKGTDLDSIAVLVRTNAMTRSIEEALVSNRIPYRFIGGARFYDRAEVRDAMAWLKLAANDLDAVSFERACTVPKRGVGPKTVQEVVLLARERGIGLTESAAEVASSNKRAGAGLTAVLEHLEAVRQGAAEGAAKAVLAALDHGVREAWSKNEDAETRLENLDALLSAAADPSLEDPSLDGFLERAALVSATDDTGTGVQLMTVHAAKGREFHTVFVPGLEEKLFPHSRAIGSPSEIKEERRLLFVACSRAEHALFMSWSRRRLLFGKPSEQSASRFLSCLDGLVETEAAPRRLDPWGSSRHANRGGSWGSRAASSRPAAPARPPVTPRPSVQRQEAAPTGPREVLELIVGDRVSHNKFGEGVVRALTPREVTVRFADRERVLSREIAPITKLD